jgi:hypothetical protein
MSHTLLSVGAAGESVFVGKGTGASDKNAHANAFVGAHAGTNNTTGDNNVFVGSQAGIGNTTGGSNSVLGADAGVGNTTGSFNTFVGVAAGRANSTGHGNTFLGVSAGDLNTTGSDNVIVGRSANTGSGNLTNAVAIGALAQVTQSNCLVLGSIAGVNAAPNGTKVGIGTTAPGSLLSLKTSAPTDPALEINQGALKVTGAGINTGTFVMIHEVTTASLLTGGGLFTVIDNPHSNGDPKAILIVTPLFNPTGPYPIPAYVVWDGSIGKWMIFVFDIGTPLTPGVRYNVLIVKP